MMDAQLRFDGKSKYCKYFDFLQEGSQLSQRVNVRTVNGRPPGVQMTRLTKLGHAAIFGRNYCNGDFLALATFGC